MSLVALRIEQFRNLEQVSLEPGPGINWLFGPNGAGKTSVLEAIHVLGRGRSFRSATISPLISDGAEALQIFARRTAPDHTLGVERRRSEWRGRIDGRDCARVSTFARALPLVVIEPSSHLLVDGSPEVRRGFLDWGLFHVEQSYLDDWRRYTRLLRQRNAALKSGASASVLDAVEEPMATAAAWVDARRADYVGLLDSAGRQAQSVLNLRLPAIGLEYRSSRDDGSGYREAWREARVRDREQGFTREGPHRADLAIRSQGRLAAPRLSRGQQKLVALVLKLAELDCLMKAGSVPLLLLDDPVSELDADHLSNLLAWLAGLPVQAWLTAVEAPTAPLATLFHVEQGRIRKML